MMRSKNNIIVAIALFTVKCAVANVVTNSFIIAQGNGVSVSQDGSIIHDKRANDDITVRARSGWLVNGRDSVSLSASRGGMLKVMSRLGEDEEHVHVYPSETNDVHSSDIILGVLPKSDNLIAMYALPDTSSVVSVSAICKVIEKGSHEETTTYYPCECGEIYDSQETDKTYDVTPKSYEWTASYANRTLSSSTWTGEISKGLAQSIEFTVTGKRDVCSSCTSTATTNVLVDVHELLVTNDLYLGLDRTDLGRTNPVVKTAIAKIDPTPTGSSTYSWTDCGICSFTGRTDQAEVKYFASNPDKASESYLSESLTVQGTVTSAEGLSVSANCTTNFTVVKVDVTIGGVDEEKEETEGAFVQYVADAANGEWTARETNALVAVSITCEPENLPEDEMVTISAPEKSLYIRYRGKYHAIPEEAEFPAYLLSDVEFVLHGHVESRGLRDREIKVEHRKSGAIDLAKFTNVKLRVTNIKFNHDTSSSSKDAINIRRSCAKGIDVSNGEWIDSGDIVTNEPFCYTTNRAVTVKARFEASGFITSAVIRATCAGAGGSLSSLLPTNVVFAGGVSSPEYVEFSMSNRTLCCIDRSLGGMLSWTADSANGQSGCKMNDSGPHLVYTILGEPKPPWKNAHGEHENAWTNALEFAIVKAGAQGKSTDKDALAAITKYLHSGHGLVYDTVEGASRYWIANSFSATAYINVTNSASGTNFVNCYDQAYGVATIGNLLGPTTAVVLWHTEPFGYINTTNLVGVGTCNNPFYNMTIQNIYVKDVSAAGSVSFDNCMPPTDLVCSVNDKTRTWFLRHKYVVLDVGGVDYVFDACAGPFCGESTRIDYLNRAIDRSTQEEELLSFYTSLRMPNFLFKNGKRDYSEKASFPIH